MIEYALLFALGFLTAALLGLLLAPVIQRRIVYFAEKRLISTMPISPQEVRAQKDAARAEHAAEAARLSHKIQRERDRATAEMLKTAEAEQKLAQARARHDALEADVAELTARVEHLTQVIVAAEAELERLRPPADDLSDEQTPPPPDGNDTGTERADASFDAAKADAPAPATMPEAVGSDVPDAAMADRFTDLKERLGVFAPLRPLPFAAAKQTVAVAASTVIARADSEPGPDSAAATIIAPPSTDEIDAFINRLLEAANPEQDEALRAQLADLAARMVAATALEEGPSSPLPALLDAVDSDPPEGRLSLAGCARRLLAKDAEA
ncbi:hypothetical protein BJF93_01010 [Xaviernesmea oryzae]|uniref:Uncharacterized protein n=1 Tax=Xaviernesmea oryzae TaxID=464029 RepID=A0A1Q9B221_9HYPH|nr:DUF4200 domain-containing protein [Xaviernesmea oryzae]OLP62063.1 hypothetical protein BJF93_01010 [Xaviernesmea oryzae]SEL86293.1 hypothetical protein SAMN04487976_1148 [Xaviernesmea oryzae]